MRKHPRIHLLARRACRSLDRLRSVLMGLYGELVSPLAPLLVFTGMFGLVVWWLSTPGGSSGCP